MEVTEKLNSAFPYVRRSREQVEKKWQNFLSKGKRALSARKQQHHRTDLAPQPDHVDQRIEHDGHVDPEPLTPSTQDTGIQLQVYPRKRFKGVQVQPVKADAMNNTDGHMVGKMKKTESTSEDSVSTSESSDVDHDKSKDYVPLDSTSCSDDEKNFKKLTLYTKKKINTKTSNGIHWITQEAFVYFTYSV